MPKKSTGYLELECKPLTDKFMLPRPSTTILFLVQWQKFSTDIVISSPEHGRWTRPLGQGVASLALLLLDSPSLLFYAIIHFIAGTNVRYPYITNATITKCSLHVLQCPIDLKVRVAEPKRSARRKCDLQGH